MQTGLLSASAVVASTTFGAVKNEVSGGAPQIWQIRAGMGAKEARHSSQIGIRLAWVSSRWHSRHPAGNNTLTRASPASASHPPACFPEVIRSAKHRQAYSQAHDK
jgi:hypothetical protein